MPKKNPIDEFLQEDLGLKLDNKMQEKSKAKRRSHRTQKVEVNNRAPLGFEAKLWEAANALRGSMDAAEYKHVVLGLIFLKYISDAFEEHRKRLEQEPYADPEDPDEYRAANVFWVPPKARWERLKQNARRPEIGQIVDEAMEADLTANFW